jgi:hypothetical protein
MELVGPDQTVRQDMWLRMWMDSLGWIVSAPELLVGGTTI